MYKLCILCEGGYKMKKNKKSSKSWKWWIYWLDTVILALLIVSDLFKKYCGTVTENDKLLLAVNCMLWLILTVMFDNSRSLD